MPHLYICNHLTVAPPLPSPRNHHCCHGCPHAYSTPPRGRATPSTFYLTTAIAVSSTSSRSSFLVKPRCFHLGSHAPQWQASHMTHAVAPPHARCPSPLAPLPAAPFAVTVPSPQHNLVSPSRRTTPPSSPWTTCCHLCTCQALAQPLHRIRCRHHRRFVIIST